MKKTILLILFTIPFFVQSCNNEDSLETSSQGQNIQFTDIELVKLFQMRGESHQVKINEATKFANDVINFLDGQMTTRSGNSREISSVVILSSDNIKSVKTRVSDSKTVEMPDTAAYLFNFANSAGYAIISGDKRIGSPILGYSDSGSLTSEISNSGLIGILADMEDYIVGSIIDYENNADSIKKEILTKMNILNSTTKAMVPQLENYSLEIREMEDEYIPTTTSSTSTTTSGWVTTSIVQPLLPVEWGQDFPFNNLVKNKNGCQSAPTGCVATALAQLMAYWQYPYSIDGYTFNWSLLRNYTARKDAYPNASNKNVYITQPYNLSLDELEFGSQVSRLMERIGGHIGMNYTNSSSGTQSEKAIDYLKTLGFKIGDFCDYDYNKIINSLNNNQPVFASGSDIKTVVQHHTLFGWINTVKNTSYSGHAWVIDGYLNQRKATTVQVIVRSIATGKVVSQTTTTTYSYGNYLHHSWGWDGFDSGYFVEGSYNSNNRAYQSITKATTTVTGEDGNYQFLKKICPNIAR